MYSVTPVITKANYRFLTMKIITRAQGGSTQVAFWKEGLRYRGL